MELATGGKRDALLKLWRDRPAFEEDVEASERALFCLVEALDDPDEILDVGECGVFFCFETVGRSYIEELTKRSGELLDSLHPTFIHALVEDDEEYSAFFAWDNGQWHRRYVRGTDPELEAGLSGVYFDDLVYVFSRK